MSCVPWRHASVTSGDQNRIDLCSVTNVRSFGSHRCTLMALLIQVPMCLFHNAFNKHNSYASVSLKFLGDGKKKRLLNYRAPNITEQVYTVYVKTLLTIIKDS